jgi:GR25 family glycosyltransferase involved in LPS biosynthesis
MVKAAQVKRQTGRIPISELLEYWIDISKRPILTLEDYALFFERAKVTVAYFSESYPQWSDKFFDRVHYMVYLQDRLLKAEKKQLSNRAYAQMKRVAKKFIPLIKNWFGADIIAAINKKTPLQDAETLLTTSTKLTYRWAAGIIISDHIATILIQLSRFKSGEKPTDDIKALYDGLRTRTTNRKLKSFLVRSFRRFEDANKLRNRCAHVIEGEPTRQEIEQSIELARLIQKYMPRK